MEKIKLGIKAKGFTGGMITGFILSFLMFAIFVFLFFYHKMQIVFALMFLCCLALTIWTLCLLIKAVRSPKVMIESDGYYLYLYEYKKENRIDLFDIKGIRCVHERGKNVTYKFGWLYITTKDNTQYKIGVIYDIDNVSKTIIELIEEKKKIYRM